MFKTALPRPCVLLSSVRSTHSTASNYYDVLNVRNDCSQKDIRESFIKLSKMHHPDSSKSHSSAAAFQAIMEAYKVLGKQDTRHTYDVDLRVRPVFHPTSGFATATDFAEMHRKAAASDSRDYYGIKGVRKLSNSRIYWAILCFAGIGVVLQAIAIKCSFVFKREQLDQASMRAHKVHTEIRTEVEKNGREEQLERVLRNMKKSS